MKFQFNKTELQGLRKQLKIRVAALPTLKNKESALRAEIKKYKKQLKAILNELNTAVEEIKKIKRLYSEFPLDLVELKDIEILPKKIAGVKIPIFQKVILETRDFSLFGSPSWFLKGVTILQKIIELEIRLKIEEIVVEILELARKKTTQKVNLYEKVQIPAYEDAILKIKRYLEDVENLDKAGSKIVKKRLAEL